MNCVVCKRSEHKVKLVILFEKKCCGSCKTAYYRALSRLHELIDRKNKNSNEVLDLTTKSSNDSILLNFVFLVKGFFFFESFAISRELIWEFLCSYDSCSRKQSLDPEKLCPIRIGINNRVTCNHCRFRKTFFTFKALARNKTVSKMPRGNQISAHLFKNSKKIVDFCMGELEKKFGENCAKKFLKNEKPEDHETQQIEQESQPLFSEGLMNCVVCSRSEEIVKLVTLFEHKCCGACKTAYFRALSRLHEHIDRKSKTVEGVLELSTESPNGLW